MTAGDGVAAIMMTASGLSVSLGSAHEQGLADEAAIWRGPLGCLPAADVHLDNALVGEVLSWRAAGGKPAKSAANPTTVTEPSYTLTGQPVRPRKEA